MSAGVAALQKVFNDCGADKFAADLGRISALLKDGAWGWVELIAKEIANVLSHRDSLGHYFRHGVKAWHVGDYKQAGFDTGRALGILIEDNPAK
jgi:hypothetical protein